MPFEQISFEPAFYGGGSTPNGRANQTITNQFLTAAQSNPPIRFCNRFVGHTSVRWDVNPKDDSSPLRNNIKGSQRKCIPPNFKSKQKERRNKSLITYLIFSKLRTI